MNENAKNLLTKLYDVYGLKDEEGFKDTYIEEVKLFKVLKDEVMMPFLYNRGFVFLTNGEKRGVINGEDIVNTPDDYLTFTATQAINCESCTYGNEPIFGLYININMSKLRKVVDKYKKITDVKTCKKHAKNITVTARTQEINDIFIRILKTLQSKVDSYMFGEQLLEELYLRALQGEHGYVLFQLCEEDSSFFKISKAVEYIHSNLSKKINVEELAVKTQMSTNNFHRLFKESFGETPIQYIKKLRLNRARQLILHEDMKAVNASQQVGYDSPAQFNREFKRYFGVTSGKIRTLGYVNY